MASVTSIKLKAAFLLVVFALNTVVGFACSMGVNMGFNSHHHHQEKHQHDHGEDNCCNDSVIKFQNLDKNQAPAAQVVPGAPVIPAVLTSYLVDISGTHSLAYSKRIIPYYYPPPPDIRVLIQSFQI